MQTHHGANPSHTDVRGKFHPSCVSSGEYASRYTRSTERLCALLSSPKFTNQDSLCALEEEINLSRLERAVHSLRRRPSYKLLRSGTEVPFLCLRSALQTLPILIWPCLLVYSAHIKNAPAFTRLPRRIDSASGADVFFWKIERRARKSFNALGHVRKRIANCRWLMEAMPGCHSPNARGHLPTKIPVWCLVWEIEICIRLAVSLLHWRTCATRAHPPQPARHHYTNFSSISFRGESASVLPRP